MPRPSRQTDRVTAILDLLAGAEDEGATMTEIATTLDVDQATSVHVLAALTTAGFVVRAPDTRRYTLGPALVRPGQVAAARDPLLAAARHEMDRLTAALGLWCFAFARAGDHARLVQYTWVVGTAAPGIRVGEVFPLVPPLGTTFFAWGPDEEFELWLALDPAMTTARAERYREQRRAIVADGFVIEIPPTVTTEGDLVRVIDDRPSPYRDGRLHRMLDDHGEGAHNLTGFDPEAEHRIHDIGAPIFDGEGRVAMSLNLIGFDDPVRGEEIIRLGRAVRAAADRVTAMPA